MARKWPTSVSILASKDFVRGEFDSDDNTKHCLIGWRKVEFDHDNDIPFCNAINDAILEAARHLKAKTLLKEPHWKDTSRDYQGFVYTINDSKSNSTRKLARIWNLAVGLLGYTVNNPEAKLAGKLLKAGA